MRFTVDESWFAGCDFTADWTSRAFGDWVEQLGALRDEPIKILEIGAWEGRGSLFFLNFFGHSKLTAVDSFALGSEARFDANVLERFPGRTTKLKGRSTSELKRLELAGEKFDLIYLEGSHLRDDVMIDSILAWRILNVGGYLIWDDYELIKAMPDAYSLSERDPKPAIDAFVDWHGGEMEVLYRDYQVIAKKTAAHYSAPTDDSQRAEEQRLASESSLNEALQRARGSEQRLGEVEAACALEQAVRSRAEGEIAAIKQDLQHKEREVAELGKALSASEASAKRLAGRVDGLLLDLRAAEEKLRSAEAAASTAEAEVSQRNRELAEASKELRELEEEKASILERLHWLLRLHEKVATEPGWWGMLPRPLRRRLQQDRLRRKGVFDGQAYLERHPDVAEVGVDPLDHYLRSGIAEGRSR